MFATVIIGVVFLKTFVDIYSLPDLKYYYSGYQEIAKTSWSNISSFNFITLKCPELGFRFILKFASDLGNFRWALFLVAILNTCAYLKLTKMYSPYVLFSLFIFLVSLHQSFFVIRQHAAISFTLLSYPYIIGRNIKRYLLLIILAFLCHQTALVFLPVYFLYGIKKRFHLLLILTFVGVVAFLFVGIAFNYFALNMVGYQGYVNSTSGNIITLALVLCYLLAFLTFLKGKVFDEGIIKLLFILQTLSFLVMLPSYQFTAVNRLMMYYTCTTFLIAPLTMRYIHSLFLRYFYCIIVLFLNLYMFFQGSNSIYNETFKLSL